MAASTTQFIYVVCQNGAQAALKDEVAARWPDLHLAFSRPGFVTFKVPKGHILAKRLDLKAALGRASGYCIDRAVGATDEERARDVWKKLGGRKFDAIHVWQRDRAMPGERGFEPGPTDASRAANTAIRAAAPEDRWRNEPSYTSGLPAPEGSTVLDIILVEPDQWWIGWHKANSWESRFAGGVIPVSMPEDSVSRAYLKMEEAIAWSRMPIKSGDTCVEIGSSPGGSSQSLLARGVIVNGVDPAEMDERVLAHPNFNHVRARGADLKLREYRGVRWLMIDMNVTPRKTLQAAAPIVAYDGVNLWGMLLTLKLRDWEMVAELPEAVAKVRRWGFAHVEVRQLAHNRREVCLAALKHAPKELGQADSSDQVTKPTTTSKAKPKVASRPPKRYRKPANFAPIAKPKE